LGYTPKHASGLNQIEVWFRILVCKLLRRSRFASVDDLKDRIFRFIRYFNLTMAKPIRWFYSPGPLHETSLTASCRVTSQGHSTEPAHKESLTDSGRSLGELSVAIDEADDAGVGQPNPPEGHLGFLGVFR
jgi:hypothetical protein